MDEGYQCFCGEGFQERDRLVEHNVARHNMTEDESRQSVLEKYPMGP